jgi:hypothetical protein
VSGREWCYVEVGARVAIFSLAGQCIKVAPRTCEEQAANVGSQKWDYCTPRIDYVDIRKRVGNAFAEKSNELADAIAVVQSLSKEASR